MGTIIIVAFVVLLFKNQPGADDPTIVTNLPEIEPYGVPRQTQTDAPLNFQKNDGSFLSAQKFVENEETEQLADDFYTLTEDENTYDIFYHQDTASIMIMLYKEPVSFTRALAERKLKESLGFSDEELCSMRVSVLTNVYVNPKYAGYNLGLSFCPGSVSLE